MDINQRIQMAKKNKESNLLTDDDTLAFVHELKDELNSKFKYKVAYEMGDDDDLSNVKEFVSTGITLIDYCLGNRRDGGFPVGRISEMHGGEGSGKTLVALMCLASTQAKGGIPILID